MHVDDWECFCDTAYYDQWAVRLKTETRWGYCFHLPTKEEAEGLCGLLNRLPYPCAPETQQPDDMSENLVVIDVSDLNRLRDQALQESAYHKSNSDYRAKHSNGVLGEAELVLSTMKADAAKNAAMIIDFILKNGKPLPKRESGLQDAIEVLENIRRLTETVAELPGKYAYTLNHIGMIADHCIKRNQIEDGKPHV